MVHRILYPLCLGLFTLSLWAAETAPTDAIKKELKQVETAVAKTSRLLSGIGRRATLNFLSAKNGHTVVQHKDVQIDQNFSVKHDGCASGVAVTIRNRHSGQSVEEGGAIDFAKIQQISALTDEIRGFQVLLSDGTHLYFQTKQQRQAALAALTQLRDQCRTKARLEQRLEALGRAAKTTVTLNESRSLGEQGGNCAVSAEGLHLPGPSKEVAKRTYPVVKIAEALRQGQGDAAVKVALLNGKESLSLRSTSLEDYQGPVRVQVLHWGGDESGVELAESLIRQRREGGRDVKVYIDTLSPLTDIRNMKYKYDTMRMYYRMMAAGIPVYGFDCKGKFSFPFLTEEIEKFKTATGMVNKKDNDESNDSAYACWRKKMHEKIWTVGDEIAITGGMNIVNCYFQLAEEGLGYWRDQDVATTGKRAVQELNEIVDQNISDYLKHQDDPKKMSCFNPHRPGTAAYQQFWQKSVEDKGSFLSPTGLAQKLRNKVRYTYSSLKPAGHRPGYENPKEALSTFQLNELDRLKHKKIVEIVDGPTKKEVERDFAPNFAADVSEYRVVPNRPLFGDLYAEDAYIKMINAAQKEIWIANSYFIPTPDLTAAIKQAALRGVKVNILSNSRETNDLPIMIPTQRYTYKELLDVNRSQATPLLRIYEYTGKDQQGKGRYRRGMYHAKHMVVDGEVYVVGSYNLDNVSRVMNSEIIQLYKSPQVAAQALDQIVHHDLEFAREVSYAEALEYHNPLKTKDRQALRLSNGMRREF